MYFTFYTPAKEEPFAHKLTDQARKLRDKIQSKYNKVGDVMIMIRLTRLAWIYWGLYKTVQDTFEEHSHSMIQAELYVISSLEQETV